MTDPPLLSIGIPLYRAATFHDTIVDNIDSIEYPNVEILISDRHLADDTIDRLEHRYGDDDRITIYRHNDSGDWWHNYNFLLAKASGKYFRWLPQDYLLPRHGLDKLVSRMENDPEVILVYSRTDTIDPAGRILVKGGHDVGHAARTAHKWGYRDALGAAAQIHHHGAGTGIFRRDVVVDAGLEIPPLRGGLGTRAFRHGLACRGRFEMVPEVVGHYRWHPGNYTSYSPKRWRHHWGYFKAARSLEPSVGRLNRLVRDLALLASALLVAPSVQFAWNRTKKGRLARRMMKPR